MDAGRHAAGLVAAGLLLLANPLYWDTVRTAPVLSALVPAVDWLGAIGLVAGGSYYVGVGAAYAVAGVVGYAAVSRWIPVRRRFRAALAMLGATTGLTLAGYAAAYRTAAPTLVVEALAVGGVVLALPFGTASTDRRRRRLAALGLALLLPWAGWVVANVGLSPTGMAARYAYLSVVLVAVLNLGWGLPIYRLGHRLGAGTDGPD